ncbi:MAG: MFS transporter [Frankiales bacterium]|nr:MFS transporter [Frankiales bacterium]
MSTATDGTPTRPPLVRDRPTWLAYLHVGLFGYFLYAFGPSIALLRDEQGYTRTVASLHGSAMAVASVVVGLLGPRVVRRAGRSRMLRLGSAILAAGLLVYTGAAPLWATLAGAFVASAGGTMIMVGVNAFLPDRHGAAGPRALSEAHGTGAALGLLGPLALGAFVAVGWGWRPALLVTVVALLALELARGRDLRPFDGTRGHADDPTHHQPHGRLPRVFWLALLVFAATAGTEFCLTLWGSDLLRERAGLGEAASTAALVTIVGGMAVGRLVGAPLVSRFRPDDVLVATMVLTTAGFAVVWLSASAVPMLAALCVTGLGMGLQSPLAIGRSVAAAGRQADRGAGLTSVAAGAASGIAPFALAALADHVGVRPAFLLVPALMLVAIALVRGAPVPPVAAPSPPEPVTTG